MSFGSNIAKLRKIGGVSQSEFAKAIGVSSVTVSSWECDKMGVKADVLMKIADYFDVSTDFLLDRNSSVSDLTYSDISILKKVYNNMDETSRKNMMKILKLVFESHFEHIE